MQFYSLHLPKPYWKSGINNQTGLSPSATSEPEPHNKVSDLVVCKTGRKVALIKLKKFRKGDIALHPSSSISWIPNWIIHHFFKPYALEPHNHDDAWKLLVTSPNNALLSVSLFPSKSRAAERGDKEMRRWGRGPHSFIHSFMRRRQPTSSYYLAFPFPT